MDHQRRGKERENAYERDDRSTEDLVKRHDGGKNGAVKSERNARNVVSGREACRDKALVKDGRPKCSGLV